MMVLLVAAFATSCHADIFRHDNGYQISGTEGITPGPGVQLHHRQLEYARLSQLDLTGSRFDFSNLANASFFWSTLTNANLTGANLANAIFRLSTLTNANLERADTRGAYVPFLDQAITRNTILPEGYIAGLALAPGQQLLIRDDDGAPAPAPFPDIVPREPIPVTIQGNMAISDGGILKRQFEADKWDSLIAFQPGIPVQLGGTLELNFAPEVDLATQIGRTLHLFNWTGVSPTGQFHVASPYAWDLSKLYTTGEVTLLSVPEPSNLLLGMLGTAARGLRRRSRCSNRNLI